MTYVQQLAATVRAARALAHGLARADTARMLALFRSAALHVSAPETAPPVPISSEGAPARKTIIAEQNGARLALKFLARGAVGPVSGFAWPRPIDDTQPGAWVEVDAPTIPCQRGIHAARTSELSHWLHDELWLVEQAGALTPGIDALVATRGRLVREIAGWTAGGALRFAHAAYDHAAELVAGRATSVPDAERCLASAARHLPRGNVTLTAFCAAMAVARSAGVSCFDQTAYDAERRWQSAYITRDLSLDAALTTPA
jgi:hypothetical protein